MTASRARLGESLSWLESHVNLEAMHSGHYRTPTLERIRELCSLMGDPQEAYPAIHITGTNGKGSVARMVSDLLSATGLSVGTYTSPDLETIRERLVYGGTPIGEGELAELLSLVALFEPMMSERPSRFELLTAAALRWFADIAVDVAVVEVGMGGRWDATNVVRSEVSVITNVALDHVEILGPTRRQIAEEKSGIVKPGNVFVVGEEDAELAEIFTASAEEAGAEIWRAGAEFSCDLNIMGVGGRMVDLSVPSGSFPGVFLPLHGAHQGLNAAVSLAATDAFLGGRLTREIVDEGFGSVRMPGRLEVMAREPLVVLDGAHNPAGAACVGVALDEEFAGSGRRVVVMGLLEGRDPVAMLENLGAASIARVIACPAPSPRSLKPAEIEVAARSLGLGAISAPSVAEALVCAVDSVEPGGLVLVTGSMYVVGAARTELASRARRDTSRGTL